MTHETAKPLLVRVQYRGFYIRAMHFFNPEVAGWKAKAFVWKHAGIPVEHFVDDPTGATFSTREHAIHASLLLGRKWVEQHA